MSNVFYKAIKFSNCKDHNSITVGSICYANRLDLNKLYKDIEIDWKCGCLMKVEEQYEANKISTQMV